MSWKITIVEIDSIVTRGRPEWKRIADSGNPKDNGPQYAYAEAPFHNEEFTFTRLEQEIDELDLVKVIKAINGIE